MTRDIFKELREQALAEQEADALRAAKNRASEEEAARTNRLKDLGARFKSSHAKSVEAEFKLLQRRNPFSGNADVLDMREFVARRDRFRRAGLPVAEVQNGRRRPIQIPS